MSSQVFECPQCGAPVEFKSSITVSAVCASCRSLVVRRDVQVETLGTMAQLPPDLSPLQLGTSGQWHGRTFELIGRLRVSWEDGAWNEWCALFPDGVMGWIADAQGIYSVSFSTGDPWLPDAPGKFSAGQTMNLAGIEWTVTDIKRLTTVAGEGELPLVSPAGAERIGIDLVSRDGGFATVEFHDGEPPHLYTGGYSDGDALALSNLRAIPGWTTGLPVESGAGALNCPACGAVIHQRAIGQTVAAVCGSCGSIVNAANSNLQLIQEADERTRSIRQLIPLGTRGKLRGVEYEVIGFMLRGDEASQWSEYLLFNPWHGFLWLVFYCGHWTLVDRVFASPEVSGTRVWFKGTRYHRFERAQVAVQAVLGEFYWRVRRGESCTATDYVAPPRVLTSEEYPGLHEVAWSVGEYLEARTVAEAFGIKNPPSPAGTYLNAPNPYLERWRSVRKWLALFLATFLVIEVVSCRVEPDVSMYQGSFSYDRSLSPPVFVTPAFDIPPPQQSVTIALSTALENNWLGMDVALTDAATERSYTGELSAEFYHGFEDGESWSEGTNSASVTFPAVTPGRYYLTMDTEAGGSLAAIPFTVQVRSGGLFPSNFLLGLLLVVAYPGYVWWRARYFEIARWSQSSYPRPGGFGQ